MSTSLYDLTVPIFIHGLRSLSVLLDKGAAFAVERGEAPESLLGTRLVPDMKPLAYQVQRVSDTAKGCIVRLGGIENRAFEDNETTFKELQARIAATIAFLEEAPRDAIDGKEDATIELKTPQETITFTGQRYVLDFAIPNFFFHVTTAYALLRHQGVPIGKRDFLGRRP
jgi:hypothetical protein